MKWATRVLILCARSAVHASAAHARTTFHESEPNDTPETFNAVSGAVRIIGTMPPGDQDGFFWSVSDVDAVKPWTFTLQGIPGALTIAEVMRLEYAEDGVTLAGRGTLFTIASPTSAAPIWRFRWPLLMRRRLAGSSRVSRSATWHAPRSPTRSRRWSPTCRRPRV
jgi:hypothetical protein